MVAVAMALPSRLSAESAAADAKAAKEQRRLAAARVAETLAAQRAQQAATEAAAALAAAERVPAALAGRARARDRVQAARRRKAEAEAEVVEPPKPADAAAEKEHRRLAAARVAESMASERGQHAARLAAAATVAVEQVPDLIGRARARDRVRERREAGEEVAELAKLAFEKGAAQGRSAAAAAAEARRAALVRVRVGAGLEAATALPTVAKQDGGGGGGAGGENEGGNEATTPIEARRRAEAILSADAIAAALSFTRGKLPPAPTPAEAATEPAAWEPPWGEPPWGEKRPTVAELRAAVARQAAAERIAGWTRQLEGMASRALSYP